MATEVTQSNLVRHAHGGLTGRGFKNERVVLEMGALQYSLVKPAVAQSSLTTIAPYMFWLMFRSVASDGLVFDDPVNAGVISQPGCVLASPSWENTATHVPRLRL